jgi:hypothetical protein
VTRRTPPTNHTNQPTNHTNQPTNHTNHKQPHQTNKQHARIRGILTAVSEELPDVPLYYK